MSSNLFISIVNNILSGPLYLRVLGGVILGASLGFIFGNDEILFGWTNADSGQFSGLYVQLLTALATPLIFFAVIDAFIQTNISGRQGVTMFCICALNVAFAFLIGLTILNLAEPGVAWREQFSSVSQPSSNGIESSLSPTRDVVQGSGDVSLSLMELIRSYTPTSIAQPFSENMILTVAVLAICIGAALRSLKATKDAPLLAALKTFDQIVIVSFQLVMKLLLWLIELAPFAVCLAVSSVVGTSGWKTFEMVGTFLLSVSCGLAIHSLIYYPLSVWFFSGRSPYVFFKEGGSAILTGFSLNSSLATSPLTLDALRNMGVGDSSARLSACVGTNFNNDGVTLYEAMTALFVAQAIGLDMSISQQITILLAALVGSMGIAGIPNSGLIILALVLQSAKLPESAIQLAIPLVFSIDFVIARMRSAVNVMGDLQVAILLDASEKRSFNSLSKTAQSEPPRSNADVHTVQASSSTLVKSGQTGSDLDFHTF